MGTNFVKREPNLTEESKTNPSDVPEFEDLETQERYAVRASYIYSRCYYCSLSTKLHFFKIHCEAQPMLFQTLRMPILPLVRMTHPENRQKRRHVLPVMMMQIKFIGR